MIIRSLELKDYRNYETLNIALDDGINIFYGDNAQGKTNILEGIYLAATTKSHRGSKDKEMIRFGKNEAHIRMHIEKNDMSHRVDMHLKRNKAKGCAIDGIPIRKSSELLGLMHVVFFSPEDLTIIKNGPAERRRFVDMELCQLNRVYLGDIAAYNKVVLQRNNLLKQMSRDDQFEGMLDVWDEQLVRYGTRVINERTRFISELSELIGPIHEKISGGREHLVLKYEPNVSAEQFAIELAMHRDNDKRLGSTSYGPHRDDLGFYIDGLNVRQYGSQGQQRSTALSLKLAEIELVRRNIHDTPVLLLDDVLSELDSYRQNYLLESINDIQTVITCTGLDEFVNHRMNINQVYYVENGHATHGQEVKDE